MGLFSLNNILLEQDNTHSSKDVIDIDNIGYMSAAIRETSFVQEGYDAILEMNAFYCNAEKEFYHKILESCGDDHIINEGFSDFFNSIKKIIKKFIDWIKKVFKEFAAKLAAIVQSEKYIKKHKDLFNKFDKEDEFDFKGYKFTNISTGNVPLAEAHNMFVQSGAQIKNATVSLNFSDIFSGDSGKYYDFKAANAGGANKLNSWDIADTESNRDDEIERRKEATKNANDAIEKMINDTNDANDEFYEYFRGVVLGMQDKKLDSKEFTDECFRVFRNGESDPETITVDYNFVQDTYNDFNKYKDTIKEIDKKKNEMIKDYEDLEKHLDKLIKYNASTHNPEIGSGGRTFTSGSISNITLGLSSDKIVYDSSTTDKMSSLLKVYSSRVNQMCQIHTQAFSAKLEAAKDSYKQDKQILNKAIQQILKHSKD